MAYFSGRARTAQLTCLAFAAVGLAASAQAAAAERTSPYDLAPQPLELALRAVAARSGRPILAPSTLLVGKRSPALHGQFTALEAYRALLNGSGLQITLVGDSVIVHDPGAAASSQDNGRDTDQIVVTGSHIRGAASAAPIHVLDRRDIDQSGYSQVGDIIRSLPENFGGGQNPGILSGAATTNEGNQNTDNASSVNLRGLGSDATLVLLDGHRLAADSGYQAADVSVIPLAALQRVEIVTDGASALYGADAVAGVANFILRQDYRGLEASERLGDATRGGGFEQTYSLLGGQAWSSGHALATVEYTHQDQVTAGERDVTSTAVPINPLLQAQTQTALVINAGQTLAPWAQLHMDGLYAQRETGDAFQVSPDSPDYLTRLTVWSYLAAPGVSFTLPGDWSATLDGSTSATKDYSGIVLGDEHAYFRYRNSSSSVEAAANGTALTLPSGALKLAVGGGYRRDSFRYDDFTGGVEEIARTVGYLFGEASVPLIPASQTRPGLHSLELTLAGRVERYSDFGTTANPKIGLRYAPLSSVTLRATWGTSFKAPQFNQQVEPRVEYDYAAADVGASGAGGASQALLTYGGDPKLKPERSRSWTAGLDWSPPQVRGLTASLTYFHIDYTDRIVQPIGDTGASLSNPIYAPFVTLNPTAAQQAAALAAASSVYNFSGQAYDPTEVVALIEDRYRNASAQQIDGVDLSIKHHLVLPKGDLDGSASASWLKLVQQTLATSAPMTLTGTLFNPPKLRAHAALTWTYGPFAATGVLNYIAGETDNAVIPNAKVGDWTTADLNLTYRFDRPGGPWPGLETDLSVSNLFDRDPPFAKGAANQFPGIYFDSTNASAIGRFVAVTLRQRF